MQSFLCINDVALSCWPSIRRPLMAMLEFPFIQKLTLHILPFMVFPDKIRDTKICLKGGLGLHFILIFIQFQSRTYPRNLLTWFQYYDEDGGKRLLNVKLAVVFQLLEMTQADERKVPIWPPKHIFWQSIWQHLKVLSRPAPLFALYLCLMFMVVCIYDFHLLYLPMR